MIVDSSWENVERLVKAAAAAGRLGPGRNFFVSNGTAQHGARAGSDTTNRGTPFDPFATWDYAVGVCTASRGDNVILMQSHAENVTAAAGIANDVAGVTVLGLGSAGLRPAITFTTAATADIDIDAANVTFDNITFVAGIDELAAALDCNANGFQMRNCDFQMTATNIQTITALDIGAVNDALIENNRFYATTGAAAAGGTRCINFSGAALRATIRNNQMFGFFSATVGGIRFAAAALQVDIDGNYIYNMTAAGATDAAISIGANAVSGVIRNNRFRLSTDGAVAPILDTGPVGLYSQFDNYVVNDNRERGLIVGTASA